MKQSFKEFCRDMASLPKQAGGQWLGFAAIAFFVLVAYAPSFMHGPRSDQIMYLAEVAPKKTLWDLTIGSIDLNRHRQITPGDEILFRPVVYLVLGAERFFFQYHFMLWQAMGIALHLLVIWMLLRLFFAMHSGWPAIFGAMFFALLMVNMEMVIWHHISSYMLCIALLLAVLWRFFEIIDGRRDSVLDYVLIFCYLTIAAMTHEMANAAALGLGVLLWFLKPARRVWAVVIACVPLVYLSASLLNAYLHQFSLTDPNAVRAQGNFWWFAGNWLYSAAFWIYAGIFPFELQWLLAIRNMISPSQGHLITPLHLNSIPTIIALGLVGVYAYCFFAQKNGQESLSRMAIAGCAVVMALIFAGIIAVGRGNQWGMWNTLRVNTYYMYIFWVFVTIGLYACIDWSAVNRWSKRMLAVFLVAFILINSINLYHFNDEQVKGNNDILLLIQILETVIRDHKHEPDFSFYVAPKYPGNFIYNEFHRLGDPPGKRYSFIEIIYPQYFKEDNPKYRFLTR